ncbi:MAG: hypothetical protein WC810_28190 [Janthinobacterium sp.]|jgi:hypothetical protein
MNKYGYEIPKRPPCPNCGKEEGAVMGSTSWGHSITCCSDECGKLIAKKINKNVSSKEYKSAMRSYFEARDKMYLLKYRGIENAEEAISLDMMFN